MSAGQALGRSSLCLAELSQCACAGTPWTPSIYHDNELRRLKFAMDSRSKTRKPHRKSRNGCLPCKGRHVKCDEQKPSCANCVKQGTSCEYRPSKSRETSTGSPMPVATPTPIPLSLETPSSNPANGLDSDLSLNVTQIRLIHHYTTVTAKTLGKFCPK
jgi:hypothetical protein